MKTVNRQALAKAVASTCGLPVTKGAQVVESVLEEIALALISGRSVELRGFGCLRPRVDPGRIVRDPQHPDKGSYRMPPRITVKFVPSTVLMDELNPELAGQR